MTAATIEHLDHFQRRVVQDALADATQLYWLRRAEAFEWARPKRGDFMGRATREEVASRDARLVEAARACRARAAANVIDETGVAA